MDDQQKASELMWKNVEKIDNTGNYDLFKDSPRHCTVGLIHLDFGGCSDEVWFGIAYDSLEEMQSEICRVVCEVYSLDLLEHFQNGKIANLTLRLGPDTLDGSNFYVESERIV